MTFAVEKAFDIVLGALIEKSKDEIDYKILIDFVRVMFCATAY